MKVDLTEQEWNQLLNCAALAPYAQVQPLIVKIAKQLADQLPSAQVPAKPDPQEVKASYKQREMR